MSVADDEIVLRAARPDLDDGRAFARYLDQAADGAFRAMLGRRVGEIIANAFVVAGHDLSYEHVTVAERGGRVAGMASAYGADEHAASSDAPLEAAAGRARWRMAAVVLVGRPLFRFIEDVPAGHHYLQSVAVDPDLRGAGIGARLVGSVEEQAVASGATHLALDVATDNERARALYERLGMTVWATSPRMWWFPGAGAHRMVKQLAGPGPG